MPQALITVNGVAGSNDDLPINTLVQLANTNVGGEITYNWSILDQPPGTADTLSNPLIVNPTFTPKKEGTYRIKLIVNMGLGSEVSNEVIAAIRQLKTRGRCPAIGETTDDSLTLGWGEAGRDWQRRVDNLYGNEFGIMVGVAGAGGMVRGNIIQASGLATIKGGLPGQETLAQFTLAPANVLANVNNMLWLLEGGVDGSPTPANGALVRARLLGHSGPYVVAAAVGDTMYVSDAALLANAPGTNTRKVGRCIASSGGNIDVVFTGTAIL